MDGPVVTFKKRAPKGVVRKAAPPPPRSSGSSGSESEGDGDGRIVKRRRIHGTGLKASTADEKKPAFEGATTFDADRSATIEASNDATKRVDWYEGEKEDLSAKSLLGSTRSRPDALVKMGAKTASRQVGPVKSSSNVRTITITDYTPDVCKDYKQTGFCGFGDGCKFLHAREDYAAGWKLDKEWELSNKGKKPGGTVVASANREEKGGDDDIDMAELEKIPFKCIICKEDYKSPVVTKCGHYFCSKCALTRFRKDPTCAACNAKTGGVFNVAKNLQKLLDRKTRYAEKKKSEEDAKNEVENE